ncbi:MAG: uroporphyrinogen-III synthase [Ilumatobacter sp.]|jgi:uroporphyrinogen-III synthase
MTLSVDDSFEVDGLAGCTVVVTREVRGELAKLLAACGADVVHVPLIGVIDADAEQQLALASALGTSPDWVIVTSVAGADRVAAVADLTTTRLAAVGTATARRLAEVSGRAVDLVPGRQLATALVEEFVELNRSPQRVVIVVADRAADTLGVGLEAAGHEVTNITGYQTVLRHPDAAARAVIAGADAVVFASGSAAQGWAEALGAGAADALPPIVAAIGPTTAARATESGLKITHVAADYSLAGLARVLTTAWSVRERA